MMASHNALYSIVDCSSSWWRNAARHILIRTDGSDQCRGDDIKQGMLNKQVGLLLRIHAQVSTWWHCTFATACKPRVWWQLELKRKSRIISRRHGFLLSLSIFVVVVVVRLFVNLNSTVRRVLVDSYGSGGHPVTQSRTAVRLGVYVRVGRMLCLVFDTAVTSSVTSFYFRRLPSCSEHL